MVSCPYCGGKMSCKSDETVDLDYNGMTKRTAWTFTEMWVCYECPGPRKEDEA